MEISHLVNFLIFIIIATFYITVGSLFFAPFFVKAIEPILFKLFNVRISPVKRYYISFIFSGITFIILLLILIL